MAIVLPLAADGNLISSAVLIGIKDGYPIFVSTLHQIGNSKTFQIVLAPHGGDVSATQEYPINGDMRALNVDLIKVDPIYDLSFFKGTTKDVQASTPKIINDFDEIRIGEEMLVLGYPYTTLGSTLETTEISNVSAKGKRLFMNSLGVEEIILSYHAYQGSSGSAVVRKSDGALCGIVRGSLTPPSVMKIGNIPVAGDSTVTYCTFSSILLTHLNKL